MAEVKIPERYQYPKTKNLWVRITHDKKDPRFGKLVEGEYVLPEFRNVNLWHVTEKVDGMNIRIIYDTVTDTVDFRGRTDRAILPEKLHRYLKEEFTPELFRSIIDPDEKPEVIILFGEGYGHGIQKSGSHYSRKQKFILFDIWIDGWWLESYDVKEWAHVLDIESVPVIGKKMTVIDIVKFCKSAPKSMIADDDDFEMEGIIARSNPLMLRRNGKDRVMFKLKVGDMRNSGLIE
jgi:hypothetical protein